jgi:hypothetical protein
VQTWSFVLLLKFSNKLKLCAPKPARTQSPKPLAVIVKRHCKKLNLKKMKKEKIIYWTATTIIALFEGVMPE